MNCLKRVITIDPGWNTGFAFWVGDIEPLTSLIREPVKRKKIKIETRRLAYMFRHFGVYMRTHRKDVDEVYIEGVALWTSSLKSMAAAQRGNLFALAYLVGGYIAICEKYGFKTQLIYPSGKIDDGRKIWKGQLGVKQLTNRIQRINGKTYPEHIREAVGIGFALMEIL